MIASLITLTLLSGPDLSALAATFDRLVRGDISQVDFHEDPAGSRPRLAASTRSSTVRTW